MVGASILVVDDDQDICANCVDILGLFGYAVDVALHGIAALEFAGQNHYRLALLDFRLPGMNGLDLFRSLRHVTSDMEGILITGCPRAVIMAEAMPVGLSCVLFKPLNFDELIPMIKARLNRLE